MVFDCNSPNDGVCDCCDGSDEYKQVHLLDRPDPTQQKKIQRFLPPCPNTCGWYCCLFFHLTFCKISENIN